MIRVLIFYQNSEDSVFIRSTAIGLKNKGYVVSFLSLSLPGYLHDFFNFHKIPHESLLKKNELKISILTQVLRFREYCKKNKINIILSHLQKANLIALCSQFFLKAKIFPTRHHIDDVLLNGNKNGILIDKIVNFLAKKIIVLNQNGKDFLINKEGVDPKKIEMIPYGYDFNLYPTPSLNINLNTEKPACILGVFGRINENKKVWKCIEIVKLLNKKNIQTFLYIVGDGPNSINIQELIKSNHLEKQIEMTGNVLNPLDYMSKIDILLHPSISEASNQVVKEAGLLNKTIICVENVGDFDEYIINSINGFKFSSENYISNTVDLISQINSKNILDSIGSKLHKTVLKKFDIDYTISLYIELFKSTK